MTDILRGSLARALLKGKLRSEHSKQALVVPVIFEALVNADVSLELLWEVPLTWKSFKGIADYAIGTSDEDSMLLVIETKKRGEKKMTFIRF